MMEKHEILVIGTVHVFDLSYELVKIFYEEKPDVICVELDETRYHSWLSSRKIPKDWPFFIKQFSHMQKKLANKFKVVSGFDMLTAIYFAQAHRVSLEFIDLDIKTIIDHYKKVTWFERAFLSYIVILTRIFLFFIGRRGFEFIYKKSGTGGKGITPFFSTFILNERNNHMANRLRELSKIYEKIVVCVGDQHIPGISVILDNFGLKYRTIKIRDLKK
jgi:pheromone shutdown protein TraB